MKKASLYIVMFQKSFALQYLELFTENNLPSDFYTVDNLNPDKVALEPLCSRPLQTILDKKIKVRRLISRLVCPAQV